MRLWQLTDSASLFSLRSTRRRSMTSGDSPQTTVKSGGGQRCKRCTGFLITLGLVALLIWIFMRPHEPKCYIEAFNYVPTLNKTLNSNSSSAIIFMVIKFKNKNRDFGIRYDDINLNVGVFLDRNRTSLIGSSTIAGFYQKRRRSTEEWSSVETHAGELDQTAKVDGNKYFRVNFTTSVKYKYSLFYILRRHRLWGGANVAVNDAGLKVEKDKIRLGHSLPVIVSGAPPLAAGCYHMLFCLWVFLSILYF